MTVVDPQPGDWVMIRAKVLVMHPNGVDLGLELFSKTDQYSAFVRRDLCEITEKPIPDEPVEFSVAILNARVAFQRHGDYWLSAAGGNQLRWAELQACGDVEVIHRG